MCKGTPRTLQETIFPSNAQTFVRYSTPSRSPRLFTTYPFNLRSPFTFIVGNIKTGNRPLFFSKGVSWLRKEDNLRSFLPTLRKSVNVPRTKQKVSEGLRDRYTPSLRTLKSPDRRLSRKEWKLSTSWGFLGSISKKRMSGGGT